VRRVLPRFGGAAEVTKTRFAAPHERLEKRLRESFAAIEHYLRQLHEIEQDQYLDMKHEEYLRQQPELQPPPT
jgi:hypothetical protein